MCFCFGTRLESTASHHGIIEADHSPHPRRPQIPGAAVVWRTTMVNAFWTSNVSRSYHIFRRPSNALSQLIEADKCHVVPAGFYQSRFPLAEKGRTKFIAQLLSFSGMTSPNKVSYEMQRRRLRPANLGDLFAFCAAYPDEPRKFPIVAPGSVSDREHSLMVPCMTGSRFTSPPTLIWLQYGWDVNYRFLGIRNN
jgi:hypothetical protein